MKELVSIIGGGISGLAFAHYCALNNYPVKVFDRGRFEGCLNSYAPVSEQHIDMGAHTLSNSYKHVIDIIKHYKADDLIIPKKRLRFNKYDHRLTPVLKGIHWLELALHIFRLPLLKKSGKSVGQFYSGILGRNNYQDLFRHVFQAVLCQFPDDYPAEFLFKKRTRNKDFPRSFTLEGGLEHILDLIASNPALSLEPEVSVDALTYENKTFCLWEKGKLLFRSPLICLACPPDTASSLIKKIEPGLASKLSEIETIRVDSILVKPKGQYQTGRIQKNIIGIRQPFYSALCQTIDSEEHWLFHFKENQYEEKEKLEIISTVLNKSSTDLMVLLQHSARMPAIKTSHISLLNEIDRYIKDKPIFISSNYMQGLSLEDCCARANKEAIRLKSIMPEFTGQQGFT